MVKAVIITNQLFKKVKLRHLCTNSGTQKATVRREGKFKAPMMLLDLLPILPFYTCQLSRLRVKDFNLTPAHACGPITLA